MLNFNYENNQVNVQNYFIKSIFHLCLEHFSLLGLL